MAAVIYTFLYPRFALADANIASLSINREWGPDPHVGLASYLL